MYYPVSSREYLKRAKRLLANRYPCNLFYAAFELRAGIEQRLREYLEARDDVAEKKKKGWKIDELSRDVERIFESGIKTVRITVAMPGEVKPFVTLYHTPVSLELKIMAGKLGDLLHAMKVNRSRKDPWWKEARSFLFQVCRELENANRGNLMGPPLKKKGEGGMFFITQEHKDLFSSKINKKMLKKMKEGGSYSIEIKYFDNYEEAEKYKIPQKSNSQ